MARIRRVASAPVPSGSRYCPHLAVVDVMAATMRRHAHEAIPAVSPGTAVAVYTARADRRTIERLLAAGVHAVFDKGASGDLADALHAFVSDQHPLTAI